MAGVDLILAVVTTGLMAGIFFGFSISVMPALSQVDDRSFVEVMQRVNAAIQNPLFGLVFLGALISSVIAVFRHTDQSGVFLWALAGLLAYLLTLVITFGINIPLNNRLRDAGPATRLADARGPRHAFESRWVRWHRMRTLTNVISFVCLLIALTLA